MKLTESQYNAINVRDRNLLVAAGAGSGKTTVLTQRLIERIKNGASVTDFLVVTFMKAAASDVKQKLYDALIKAYSEDESNTHLLYESLLVPEANICTISSYCLNLVKENFALLGISPHVRVIDETESAMLLKRAAEELMERGYNSVDSGFMRLVENFSGAKSDDNLRDTLVKLYTDIRVIIGYKELLSSCADTLREDARITSERGLFASASGGKVQSRLTLVCTALCDEVDRLYEKVAVCATEDSYVAPFAQLKDNYHVMLESLSRGYVSFCEGMEIARESITVRKKGCDPFEHECFKSKKEEIVKELTKLEKRYCRGDEKLIADSFRASADIVDAVRDFIVALDELYTKEKSDMGALDYTDFEQKALSLLEAEDENGNTLPSELCKKLRSSFKEILIDEYQDVNPMQDRIFGLLSNGRNRFMVGDIKQSIYRFRNAFPGIFKGYLDTYPDYDADTDSDSSRILLRENFRCSKSVIDYVNLVFATLTPDTPYHGEYKNQELVFAKPRKDGVKYREFPVVLAVSPKLSNETDAEESTKAKAERAIQAEAEYVASEIQRLLREETDEEGNPLKYSDIAIMMSAMKGYSIPYEQALRKYGVPYRSVKSESFLENPTIRLAISALRAIDDPSDDISLCSLMRSPIAMFDSDDLYKIRRKAPKLSFWSAVRYCACPSRARINGRFRFSSRRGASCLAVRTNAFARRLVGWRKESEGITCHDFLKKFFVSSGLIRIAAANGSRPSLMLLFDYSARYESATNYGLSGFLDYITELSKSGKEIADAAASGTPNSVSLMTVHKSKGLEYKVCFIVGAHKRFRGAKRSAVTLNRDRGIFFALKNRDNMTTYDPICNVIAADEEESELFGEELRKLYVALTRAKERLYVTGCVDEDYEDKTYVPLLCRSWLDLLIAVTRLDGVQHGYLHMKTIGAVTDASGYIPEKMKTLITPTESHLEAVRFVYPYADAVTSARKVSVSELREGLLEDDEYNRSISIPYSRVSKKPAFASESTVSPSDIGTANHLFMQFCSFENVVKDGVASEANRLLEIRMITEAQYSMLDIPSLERFFGSKLFSRMLSSDALYREKRFSVRDRLTDGGEAVLVQGVIDCFFKNPDGTYTVVDYKTDRVKEARELTERHRTQLSCYRRAVGRMTGAEVSELVIYSFSLDCEVRL